MCYKIFLKLLTVDELLIADVEAEVSDVLALKKKHKSYFQNNQKWNTKVLYCTKLSSCCISSVLVLNKKRIL